MVEGQGLTSAVTARVYSSRMAKMLQNRAGPDDWQQWMTGEFIAF
jgi:hypothetical protein